MNFVEYVLIFKYYDFNVIVTIFSSSHQFALFIVLSATERHRLVLGIRDESNHKEITIREKTYDFTCSRHRKKRRNQKHAPERAEEAIGNG